jgi:N-acetyl-gamma-glutamyl-phosphate reductase
MTIRASIIGITGYTGLEQLRMLLAHPQVEIAYLTSRTHDNVPIGEVYPHLSHLDLKVTNTDHAEVAKNSDVVFLALPHKTAQDVVAELHGKVKLIDHSADYRLGDLATYEKFYGPHTHPELLSEVVYGAVEINREKIKKAQTVANPGCFALLGQLMLLPFAGAIEHADVMAITGSSGSGKTPGEGTHHPVRNHNVKSYNINAHRHIPEIIRTSKIKAEQLNFVPTSGPFTRGIFATAFVQTKNAKVKCAGDLYQDHPFVRVMESVALANIVGSNYCDLSYQKISDTNYIVQGALDNVTKGAAGNATQVMNLMFGLDEKIGLSTLAPVYP